jgi:hypothetical protein
VIPPQRVDQGLYRDQLAVLGCEHLEHPLGLAGRRGTVEITLDSEAPE